MSQAASVRCIDINAHGADSTVAPGWGKFVYWFAAALALLFLSIAGFNFIVNPMGLYPTRIFPVLVWNPREAKAQMLDGYKEKPQALILGSSRTMKIAPADVQRLTGLRTFNAGVSSAMVEDYYVMLRYAVERAHVNPKLVLIGVDLEAFDSRLQMDWWLLPSRGLSLVSRRVSADSWAEKFNRAFSASQTRLSLQTIEILLTRNKLEPLRQLEPDGYVHWLDRETERAEGRLDLNTRIRETIGDYKPRFASDDISEDRLHYLESTLQYCHEHGFRAVVFLTPWHPRVIEALQPMGFSRRHDAILKRVSAMSEASGAQVYDFSDVSSFDGIADGFFDGIHIDERNASRLTARLLVGSEHAVQ
jgi:hypothetical protein